jgi:hypothetical protein
MFHETVEIRARNSEVFLSAIMITNHEAFLSHAVPSRGEPLLTRSSLRHPRFAQAFIDSFALCQVRRMLRLAK